MVDSLVTSETFWSRVSLPTPGICTLQNFWNVQKCKSCSFKTGLCTRFNPDVNMSQFYWGQQSCFTYINSDFFSNSFRSRVLFREHDKTADLKVHLVISGSYFEILCMHCSFISWNLSCFKASTAWKTSACMSSIVQTILWGHLENPVYDMTEEVMCTPESFDFSVASMSFTLFIFVTPES